MDSRQIRSEQFLGGGVAVHVRRDQIIQDAYDGLASLPEKRLKGRIQIEFISEQGLQEAGIDGGGLFKAFLDAFMKAAFDPIYGLFVPTTEQLLTPNPASAYVATNHLQLFNFFGKMLGVAIYNVSNCFCYC
jgi:ubiquitin-protein ligase E3 C